MPEANDMELIRDYERNGSESAFAELVHRHINLVYSVALRHVGITAQAEEITQAVFVILARKAANLRAETILEGWLHTTTRLTALSFLRGERRRQFREQEAYMQSTLQEAGDTTNDVTWEQLAPLLDEAVSRLGKKDRDALVLRFFKNQSIREVAAVLETTEGVAQRRVLRALEKLRRYFTKRGVSLTTPNLGETMSTHSIQAAPMLLAKTVTGVAIVKGSAAAASTITLVKATMNAMTWLKIKFAATVGMGVIALATISAIMAAQPSNSSNPTGTFNLVNVPVDQVLNLYQSATKLELIGTTNAQWAKNGITLHGTNVSVAAFQQMVEKALLTQAGISLTHLDNKRVSVTYDSQFEIQKATIPQRPTFILTSHDVFSNSVRIATGPAFPVQNLIFKFVGKSSDEIKAIYNQHPTILIMKGGKIVMKCENCALFENKANGKTSYVGLVLIFNKYDEAKLAEKTLRGN